MYYSEIEKKELHTEIENFINDIHLHETLNDQEIQQIPQVILSMKKQLLEEISQAGQKILNAKSVAQRNEAEEKETKAIEKLYFLSKYAKAKELAEEYHETITILKNKGINTNMTFEHFVQIITNRDTYLPQHNWKFIWLKELKENTNKILKEINKEQETPSNQENIDIKKQSQQIKKEEKTLCTDPKEIYKNEIKKIQSGDIEQFHNISYALFSHYCTRYVNNDHKNWYMQREIYFWIKDHAAENNNINPIPQEIRENINKYDDTIKEFIEKTNITSEKLKQLLISCNYKEQIEKIIIPECLDFIKRNNIHSWKTDTFIFNSKDKKLTIYPNGYSIYRRKNPQLVLYLNGRNTNYDVYIENPDEIIRTRWSGEYELADDWYIESCNIKENSHEKYRYVIDNYKKILILLQQKAVTKQEPEIKEDKPEQKKEVSEIKNAQLKEISGRYKVTYEEPSGMRQSFTPSNEAVESFKAAKTDAEKSEKLDNIAATHYETLTQQRQQSQGLKR